MKEEMKNLVKKVKYLNRFFVKRDLLMLNKYIRCLILKLY